MVRLRPVTVYFEYFLFFFFFNDTATTEIYTLSLHDALPICVASAHRRMPAAGHVGRHARVVAGNGRHARPVVAEPWHHAARRPGGGWGIRRHPSGDVHRAAVRRDGPRCRSWPSAGEHADESERASEGWRASQRAPVDHRPIGPDRLRAGDRRRAHDWRRCTDAFICDASIRRPRYRDAQGLDGPHVVKRAAIRDDRRYRSEEHTSDLQS